MGGWSLEPEPVRCRIDTWARACVPIKKKLVRPKNAAADKSARSKAATGSKTKDSSSTGDSRVPSRAGAAPMSSAPLASSLNVSSPAETQDGAKKELTGRPQVIPIVDEREVDEEEEAMREMKEREARRRKDEEVRQQQKQAAEVEHAAKLAQMKDQLKNRPCAYDSAGNIIWVTPPNMAKLPSANPVPNFACKKRSTRG